MTNINQSRPSGDRLETMLRSAPEEALEPFEALREQFTDLADHEGLVDVAHRTVDSPVGTLLLAATDEGLVCVAFDDVDDGAGEPLARLARDVSPRILQMPSRLDDVASQLDEYFAGRRTQFDLRLDLRLAHGFRRTVLDRLRNVAYGTTTSYAGLATAAGSPKAVRAVGSACATNPIPIVVPCHRVLRSDGSLGGYGGGIANKRLLLDLEHASAA